MQIVPHNKVVGVPRSLVLLLALLLQSGIARANTAVGDWGHFISMASRVHLHNPDGEAFTFTVHLMRWPIAGWGWNGGDFPMRVVNPEGKVLLEDQFSVEKDGNTRSFDIPAGTPGAYTVEFSREGNVRQMVNVWVSSTLDRSVVFTGKPEGSAFENQWLVTQPSVPRRWWFWVPQGTTDFIIRTQRDIGNTEREAPGITVFSPRGQRVAALFGQPFKNERLWAGDKKWRDNLERRIRVVPGNAGRFWSVEVRLGDAHNYSNINLSLEGVPPYVARSPEEWFNPETGETARITPYDAAKYMQSVADETLPFQMWSPAPSLGDPDGILVRGDARFALWNPENRQLRFDICDYLVRKATPDAPVPVADVRITSASGKEILDTKLPVPHHHDGAREPRPMPPTGKGLAYVDVSGVERWFAYTYPATPLVLLGQPAEDGYDRFNLEVGTARNWYFFVPKGTERFQVRARTEHPNDVIHLQINAPDRVQAIIYGRSGAAEVEVPEGLDGKIWHVRPDIGGATRIETGGDPSTTRYLGIDLILEFRGVPAYLAPTWEQWFDPDQPNAAPER